MWFGNGEILHISLRVIIWVLGQSCDCPGAGEAALKNRVNKSYESNEDITQIYACLYDIQYFSSFILQHLPPLAGTPAEEEYAPAVTTLVQEICLEMRSIVQIYDEMWFYILDRLTKFENFIKRPAFNFGFVTCSYDNFTTVNACIKYE